MTDQHKTESSVADRIHIQQWILPLPYLFCYQSVKKNGSFHHLLIGLVTLVLIHSSSLLAANVEGVLPRGKGVGPGSRLILPERQQKKTCQRSVASFSTGLGFFSSEDTFFYLAQSSSEKKGKHRYYLIKIDLSLNMVEKKVSLLSGTKALIFPHGQPLKSILLFTLTTGDAQCLMGQGSILNLKTQGKKIAKKSSIGPFRLVDTTNGKIYADLKTHSFRQFDLQNLQTRKLWSFPQKTLPIYFDSTKKTLLSLDRKTLSILTRHHLPHLKLDAKLPIKPGYRLLRQGSKIGVLTKGSNHQELMIAELQGWSGKKHRKYLLKLPTKLSPDQVSVTIGFKHKIAFIYGNQSLDKKELREVYLFHFQSEKLIHTVSLPHGHYVEDIVLNPNESYAILFIKEIKNETLSGITTYDVKTKKWQRMHLNF